MKAKLIVEGKEFPIEIHDPELQKLLMPQKKTGYEKVPNGTPFYISNEEFAEDCLVDENNKFVELCELEEFAQHQYDVANYYSDERVANDNARADKLMRQLRRFAVETRTKELDWNNEGQKKYYIQVYYDDDNPTIQYTFVNRVFGVVYFDTKEAAQLAIKTFHDELIWYFTEYKDSL